MESKEILALFAAMILTFIALVRHYKFKEYLEIKRMRKQVEKLEVCNDEA